MPPVLRDLFASEKAVLSILLIIVASVLFGVGKLSADQWKEFTIWIAGIYLGAKGIQGAAVVIASRPSANESPSAIATIVNETKDEPTNAK